MNYKTRVWFYVYIIIFIKCRQSYQIVPNSSHNVYGVTYVQLNIIMIKIKMFDWNINEIEPYIKYIRKYILFISTPLHLFVNIFIVTNNVPNKL